MNKKIFEYRCDKIKSKELDSRKYHEKYLNKTIIYLSIFAILFSVNLVYAMYGNDVVLIPKYDEAGMTFQISDPDGIARILIFDITVPPQPNYLYEKDFDCPNTRSIDITLPRNLNYTRQIMVWDCQKPKQQVGIFRVDSGNVHADRIPSPPAPTGVGIDDSKIDNLREKDCRNCHNSTYLGGVPTRHHNLVPSGEWSCTNCHPKINGQSVLLERDCLQCHNGTAWRDNSSGVNISRPHHINTEAAKTRQCNQCHGSLVDNYNDGHYVPSYNTSLATPYADNKVYNSSSGRYWGGCLACHQNYTLPYTLPTITLSPISNLDTHHSAILGNSSGVDHQKDQTTGVECNWCHVINISGNVAEIAALAGQSGPLNDGRIMELRNSSVDTLNGTACEKCHSVQSIHNIQWNYTGTNGLKGYGHIGDDWDCSGCHANWDAGIAQPFSEAIIPDIYSITPSVLLEKTENVISIEGTNLLQDGYITKVYVDGVIYNPISIKDSEIMATIPTLAPGTHKIKVVKGNTISKLYTLTVVAKIDIKSAKLKGGAITILGTGFGTKPVQNAQQYITIAHAGNIYYSDNIQAWSNTQIKTKNSIASVGDTVTITTSTGSASAIITI